MNQLCLAESSIDSLGLLFSYSISKQAISSQLPKMKDLTIDNITENVHFINGQCSDRRLKFIVERLVSHAHDLVRETRLSTEEWMAAIQFLTEVGQTCTETRQVNPPTPLADASQPPALCDRRLTCP